jgi:hypothetical protein
MLNQPTIECEPPKEVPSTFTEKDLLFNGVVKQVVLFSSAMNNIKSIVDPAKKNKIMEIFSLSRAIKKSSPESKDYSELRNNPIAQYDLLRRILSELNEGEIDNVQKQDLLEKFPVDVKQVAIAEIQSRVAETTTKIRPSFCYIPALDVHDLQHAYSSSSPQSFAKASLQAASNYEDHLRLGIKAMIIYAKSEIMKSEAKLETRDDPELRRTVIGVPGKPAANIFGNAPERGGTKRLYSLETPSGTQCLVGYRTMGESNNYCCYPMAELDEQSSNWIKYQPSYMQEIYKKSNGSSATIAGMHLTISVDSVSLSLTPLSADRKGTQYVSNGSHTSIDCQHLSPEKGSGVNSFGLFRLQFRPRVEPSILGDETFSFVLRCGRPILIPLKVSKPNRLPTDSLTELTTVLKREKTQGLLVEKGGAFKEEHQFLKVVMESRLYSDGQSVICEIAMIGKFLLLNNQIDLHSTDEQVLSAYQQIVKLLEVNPDYFFSIQEKLDIFNCDLVEHLSPTPIKLQRPS